MKWMQNSVVRLTLLACYCCQAKVPTREQIFLRLYRGNHIDNYVDVQLEEAESLIFHIDNSKTTVFYIHGFTESVNSTSVHTVISAYLNRTDHNVLALDWSVIAGDNYIQVVKNVDVVGTAFALALDDMIQAGLSSEKLHIIGHSMGAQVAGYVGRNVDFLVPRITGLDPAGPFFNLLEKHVRSSDAQFVDIIHTDWSHYGIARTSGSVDFFPNGGRRIQPGCPTTFQFFSKEDFCSHHRSWVFYSESLANEKAFLAIQCSPDNRALSRKLDVSDTIVMGYGTPTDAKGSYCLFTAATAPYGRGIEGAREA